ncbi:hypothetical protein RRG08_022590 [Elysia crispata]|uniref:Uncharacterized protein n=1 Tax=Elysia crispata TaxID=231223 RepID=A0AAE1D906_9GAST|nr:hypothetical protein RRG08_022590 [Elysia crispata]
MCTVQTVRTVVSTVWTRIDDFVEGRNMRVCCLDFQLLFDVPIVKFCSKILCDKSQEPYLDLALFNVDVTNSDPWVPLLVQLVRIVEQRITAGSSYTMTTLTMRCVWENPAALCIHHHQPYPLPLFLHAVQRNEDGSLYWMAMTAASRENITPWAEDFRPFCGGACVNMRSTNQRRLSRIVLVAKTDLPRNLSAVRDPRTNWVPATNNRY